MHYHYSGYIYLLILCESSARLYLSIILVFSVYEHFKRHVFAVFLYSRELYLYLVGKVLKSFIKSNIVCA